MMNDWQSEVPRGMEIAWIYAEFYVLKSKCKHGVGTDFVELPDGCIKLELFQLREILSSFLIHGMRNVWRSFDRVDRGSG